MRVLRLITILTAGIGLALAAGGTAHAAIETDTDAGEETEATAPLIPTIDQQSREWLKGGVIWISLDVAVECDSSATNEDPGTMTTELVVSGNAEATLDERFEGLPIFLKSNAADPFDGLITLGGIGEFPGLVYRVDSEAQAELNTDLGDVEYMVSGNAEATGEFYGFLPVNYLPACVGQGQLDVPFHMLPGVGKVRARCEGNAEAGGFRGSTFSAGSVHCHGDTPDGLFFSGDMFAAGCTTDGSALGLKNARIFDPGSDIYGALSTEVDTDLPNGQVLALEIVGFPLQLDRGVDADARALDGPPHGHLSFGGASGLPTGKRLGLTGDAEFVVRKKPGRTTYSASADGDVLLPNGHVYFASSCGADFPVARFDTKKLPLFPRMDLNEVTIDGIDR